MEFNKLEEDIVRADGSNAYEGAKMRRTQFESESEKLASTPTAVRWTSMPTIPGMVMEALGGGPRCRFWNFSL